MAEIKELKDRFNAYLNEYWKDNQSLQQSIDRFWLRIFDVFLLGIKKYKRWAIKDRYSLFSQIVSPGLKYLLDNSFWDMYFRPKTYNKYKDLFLNFVEFCDKDKEYIDWILFQDEWKKLENSLDGKYWMFEKKAFIKNRHEFIKNDKWENGDKFRKYLAEIYGELNSKQIKLLYELFFEAYEKCSKINYKNKRREKDKKINAFDVAFSELSDGLSKINVRWNSLEKIKSIFWKYLNFIPVYRNRIGEVLDDDMLISEWSNIQDWAKAMIIDSIRDPNWANYDIVDWEVIAPLDNYWIFPDSDNTSNWKDEPEDKEETTYVKNSNEKGNSERVETTEPIITDDPNQDELYKFDPDEENRWNR